MKGAYGERKTPSSVKPWEGEERSCGEALEDALLEERGGRGSGLPGWDRKGKLNADGGGGRMKIGWADSSETSRMSWEGGAGTCSLAMVNLRNLFLPTGFGKGDGWVGGMGTAGERSRSGSEFTELTVEDQEERLLAVMKRGWGGARGTGPSVGGSWEWEPSSLAGEREDASTFACSWGLCIAGEREESSAAAAGWRGTWEKGGEKISRSAF